MTKKKYLNATIKLVIGLILLGASWMYLDKHPGEKASLLSGAEVLQHKITVWIQGLQGKDTTFTKQQYKLKRYIEEMEYTAQHTSGCDGEFVQEIQKVAQEVETQDPSLTKTYYSNYWSTIREWETHIQNHCPTEKVSE